MDWISPTMNKGALELRYDMACHALRARRAALLTRRVAIALVVALLTLQLTALVWPFPWAAWVVQHRAMLALASTLLTCFTIAHQWCAERRLAETEDALLAFVECRR